MEIIILDLVVNISKYNRITMIKVKYTDWSNISIDLYKKITKLQNEEMDDLTKEVAILALFCESKEDDIWNLNINEVNSLRSQLQFINKIDFNKHWNNKHIKIGDIDCDVTVDLNKFSYAQYVDFQHFYSNNEDISKLLSTIIIPKGKKYNDGYDIVEFINNIENNLDILTANSICFFFLHNLLISIRRMNLFLLGQMMMKKIMTKKTNPMYQKLKTAIESSKQIHSILTSVLSKK